MTGDVVARRDYDAFVSHAHIDRSRADELVTLLRDVAGVRLWFDAADMPPSTPIASGLYEGITRSRAMIILLSRTAVEQGWVQKEYDAAVDHQTRYPDFRILPVRLDDVTPPHFLGNVSHIELQDTGIGPGEIAQILAGLYRSVGAVGRPGNGRTTFLSRGWRPPDAALAARVCAAAAGAALALVGDAQDQKASSEARVGRIMDGSGAYVAVLPHRAGRTSDYVLREWEMALERDLPCAVVADPQVRLEADLAARPGLVPCAPGVDHSTETLADAMADLAERWREPRRPQSIFYATDFGGEGAALRSTVQHAIEAATGLPCRVGDDISGPGVQGSIVRAVAEADLVLADLTEDGPNVYVEVGAALAAGVDLALMRRGDRHRPPFMLRDREVRAYRTDAELVALAVRQCYGHRRAVITTRR